MLENISDIEIVVTTLAIAIALILVYCVLKLRYEQGKREAMLPKCNSRSLGIWESMWTLAHDLAGIGNRSNIIFIQSRNKLNESDVREAAQRIACYHPLLNVTIDNSNKFNLRFVPGEKTQLPVEVSHTEKWEDLLECAVLKMYNYKSEALWKLWFLPNAKYTDLQDKENNEISSYPYECACIFSFHHAIVDGRSDLRIAGRFLSYLDDSINGLPNTSKPFSMLPPIEHFMDSFFKESLMDQIRFMLLGTVSHIPGFAAILVKWLTEKNTFITACGSEIQKNPSIKPCTHILPLEFSCEETAALVAACRKHHTAVQGAVQAAASVAIATIINHGILKGVTKIKVNVPINLRHILGVPDDYAGVYSSEIQWDQTTIPVHSKADFWKLANNITKTIECKVRFGEMYEDIKEMGLFISMLMNSSSPLSNLFHDPSHRMECVLTVSARNCTFLEQDDSSNVKLRALFSCDGEHEGGSVFVNNIVTFGGQLFWSVNYSNTVLSEVTAKDYIKKIKDTLDMAILPDD